MLLNQFLLLFALQLHLLLFRLGNRHRLYLLNRYLLSSVAFGHWSSLAPLHRNDVIELDTGCVWGGCLSALELNTMTGEKKRWQVKCDAEASVA